MGRGVTRFKSMSGFKDHRTGGGGGKFLSKWKEKGSIDVWFHIKELPLAIWRHQVPTITIVDNKQTRQKDKRVFSKSYVCHEREDVLEGQYFRKDDGTRKHPPVRCGLCKLVDWAYRQCLAFEEHRKENEEAIEAKKSKRVKGIRFTTTLFKFVGDDPEETQTMHIGGLCNIFNRDDLSDAMRKDIADSHIKVGGPKGAWRENMFAKCQYAMCVVNNDRPDDGVQIAMEASSLGDKVKDVFNAVLKEDERDIETDPYCVCWEYFEKETNLNKKYNALPKRKVPLTPRIKKLITGEAPDLSQLTENFNQQLMRSQLEAACVLPEGVVPWDELFPTKEQEEAWAKEDDAEEEEEEDESDDASDDDDDDDAEPAKAKGKSDDADDDDDDDDDEDESDDELVECDNPKCAKPMKMSDAACPHCGQKYDVEKDDAPEPEPEKPKMKTRAELAAEKKAKAAGTTGGGGSNKSSKASAPAASATSDDNQGDEIPF